MTAINRNPENPNLLHGNKFQLNFSRMPSIQYFAQNVILPGVSLMEYPRTNPFVELYSPGEKAIYDLLTVTFMVDEELTAWKEVHDWIRAMTFPENFEEYANLPNIARPTVRLGFPQFSDARLTLLSNANQPIFQFDFIDIFPTTLSSMILSTTHSPEDVITADAIFRFSYYNVKSLK